MEQNHKSTSPRIALDNWQPFTKSQNYIHRHCLFLKNLAPMSFQSSALLPTALPTQSIISDFSACLWWRRIQRPIYSSKDNVSCLAVTWGRGEGGESRVMQSILWLSSLWCSTSASLQQFFFHGWLHKISLFHNCSRRETNLKTFSNTFYTFNLQLRHSRF